LGFDTILFNVCTTKAVLPLSLPVTAIDNTAGSFSEEAPG